MTDENKIKSQEPSTQSSPGTKEPANYPPPFQYLLIPKKKRGQVFTWLPIYAANIITLRHSRYELHH